jgi:PAS domain S-box-containing protein
VWFQLAAVGGPAAHAEGPFPAPRATDSTLAVQLIDVPLLLHEAWRQHAESLLREYLLASLDEGFDGEDPIQVHADATDAIAVLEEHVPRARILMSPDDLMGGAVEPLVSAQVIQVPVPIKSVANFETLDRAIEGALDLSREGLVLTPPTQPEVQAFRRWLCRQVLSQAAGGRPEAWRTPDDASSDTPNLEDWDPRVVTEAAEGLLAADATSRIIAVSPQAARILGYDDPTELTGKRIVTIVPERYRQAHVAGFTMYLLVGRKPLLDHQVTLPALRRDGSEVDVRLTVRSPTPANGRSVLLADLELA